MKKTYRKVATITEDGLMEWLHDQHCVKSRKSDEKKEKVNKTRGKTNQRSGNERAQS